MVAYAVVQHCKVVVCENEIVIKRKNNMVCMRKLLANPSGKGLSICTVIATE